MEKEYEVVVFGATGFTGKLVAEYLFKQYGVGKSLRWAIAGRSLDKLNSAKRDIGELTNDANGANLIPTIVADSHNEESLNSLCARTDCIASTVGPFAKHGTLLVKCCVKNGTAYCDTTGETVWIKNIIDMFHDEAVANKVRLVPSCAFDSLPSDLGALKMVNGMKGAGETGIGEVVHFIGPMKGGMSGGTAHTILNIFANESKSAIQRVANDPYVLAPEGYKGPSEVEKKGMHWEKEHKVYSAPFVMAGSNSRVVLRSAGLLEYGSKFQFREVTALLNPVKAFLVTVLSFLGLISMILPPTRWIAKQFLPKPGDGPSRKAMEKGYTFTTLVSSDEDKKKHYTVEVGITKGDAGYLSTAFMLAESAICLAQSKNEEGAYGLLTPASCPGMGEKLMEVLSKNCGITFDFSSHGNIESARQRIKAIDSKL